MANGDASMTICRPYSGLLNLFFFYFKIVYCSLLAARCSFSASFKCRDFNLKSNVNAFLVIRIILLYTLRLRNAVPLWCVRWINVRSAYLPDTGDLWSTKIERNKFQQIQTWINECVCLVLVIAFWLLLLGCRVEKFICFACERNTPNTNNNNNENMNK